MKNWVPLAVIGVLLSAIVVVVVSPASYEERLESAVMLNGQTLSCSGREPDFYALLLDSDGDKAPDIVAYGKLLGGRFLPPIAYLFYETVDGLPSGGIVHGKTYTFEEIKARWPRPCDLGREEV